MSPEEYLSAFPTAIREMANQVRALISECLPGRIERVYAGWKLIGYRIPDGKKMKKSRYCCYLVATTERVELGFEHGRFLSDPRGALEGDGTQVRKIVFTRPSDIRKRVVRQLLLEAAMITIERGTWKT